MTISCYQQRTHTHYFNPHYTSFAAARSTVPPHRTPRVLSSPRHPPWICSGTAALPRCNRHPDTTSPSGCSVVPRYSPTRSSHQLLVRLSPRASARVLCVRYLAAMKETNEQSEQRSSKASGEAKRLLAIKQSSRCNTRSHTTLREHRHACGAHDQVDGYSYHLPPLQLTLPPASRLPRAPAHERQPQQTLPRHVRACNHHVRAFMSAAAVRTTTWATRAPSVCC